VIVASKGDAAMPRISTVVGLAALTMLVAALAACAPEAPTSPPAAPATTAPSATEASAPTPPPSAATATTTTASTTGGASAEAVAFCAEYLQTCGFGGELVFASEEACLAAYDNDFDADRKACVETHLDYAAADKAVHCPHAAGAAPCD
jgi:hypothetical protein